MKFFPLILLLFLSLKSYSQESADSPKSAYNIFNPTPKSLNGGPTYSISENLHFDCGVYYGIKNISSKTYFVGMSFRI